MRLIENRLRRQFRFSIRNGAGTDRGSYYFRSGAFDRKAMRLAHHTWVRMSLHFTCDIIVYGTRRHGKNGGESGATASHNQALSRPSYVLATFHPHSPDQERYSLALRP